jgi:hypothetical protein
MRIIKPIAIPVGLVVTLLLLAILLYTNRLNSIRFRVQSLSSIQSLERLSERVGKPDAITSATPDIHGVNWTLCFEYYGGNRRKFRWKSKFPFIESNRFQTRTRVHLLGRDQTTHLAQINEELEWGPRLYNRAIAVQDFETSPDPLDCDDLYQKYFHLIKPRQNMRMQRDGLKAAPDPRR